MNTRVLQQVTQLKFLPHCSIFPKIILRQVIQKIVNNTIFKSNTSIIEPTEPIRAIAPEKAGKYYPGA